ncbi:L,D-transpeptidase family protein [Aquihabitans daechungensis]|uniref:L,D-transpeptidase family protein n=1 Tax=Aquihabitans daechungensis TaxID=1052257 RepID=UPI003BA2270E
MRRSLVCGALLVALVASGCSGSTGGKVASGGSSTVPTTEATTSTEATSTTTTAAPTTTTEAPTTTTTAPPDPTTLTEPAGELLKSGSVGTRTKAVQQALKDQHYDPGEPDGKFGLKTTMSVWAFQKLHNIPADGVVGPQTEALILAKPAQEMLRPNLGPTHTEVDLSRQVMIVWRDGQPTLITHVSTGSGVAYCEDTKEGENCGDALTPEGVYAFNRRVEGWREAPLGKLYNPVYFNGGIAVHGAASVPDHPASHGCVRIPMSIAEYFPTLVNTGDPIEVFRS